MYSRSQDRSGSPIRVPEHYSGCAFSTARPPQPKKQEEAPPRPPLRHPAPAKPSPPPVETREEPPHVTHASSPALLLPPISAPPKEDPKALLPPKPVGTLFGSIGSAFPFSHGIGFDELLIIGLILLLARSGQDSDMILWLALLLFCG